MAKKVNNQGKAPAAPQRRLPQVVKQRPSVPLDSLIRQARLDPALLAPSELSQLQRTMGNQAVGRLLAQTAPAQAAQRRGNLSGGNGGGVIQAKFEDIFTQTDVPVLYSQDQNELLSEAKGRDYMNRITAGDADVLNELIIYGANVMKEEISQRIKDQAVECGLGKDPNNDRVAIFVGDEKETKWNTFLDLGLIPLAHSHPYTNDRKLNLEELVSLSDVFKNPKLGTLILPSMGDLWFAADQKVKCHTVYTPYKIIQDNEDYLVTDAQPVQDAEELLSFEITDAQEVNKKEEDNIEEEFINTTEVKNYEGQLTAKWQGKSILKPITVTAARHIDNDDLTQRAPVQTKSEESQEDNISFDEEDQKEIDLLVKKSNEIDKEFDFGDDN